MDTKYIYPMEKLMVARRALMLPHYQGENQSIVRAFHECELGLKGLSAGDFDDNGRNFLDVIRRTMDTAGLRDSSEKGLWLVKAEQLSFDEKTEFSGAVDALCYWLEERTRT